MLALYLQLIETEEGKTEFEKLYYQYRKLMYYIAMDYLKDGHLSEDAVSETFLKLAKKFDKIRLIGTITSPKVKRYVVVSVKHTAINMLKQNKRHPEEGLEVLEVEAVSEDLVDSIIEAENYNDVISAINGLPDIYRDVLQLYAVCDHDIADVANMLDVSKETVYKRVQRARVMLKERMKVKK